MILWAGTSGLVDRKVRFGDNTGPERRAPVGMWTTPTGQWTVIPPPTRDRATSSTIHITYYCPCKNYIPLRKDLV